jgi:hypothetical protein
MKKRILNIIFIVFSSIFFFIYFYASYSSYTKKENSINKKAKNQFWSENIIEKIIQGNASFQINQNTWPGIISVDDIILDVFLVFPGGLNTKEHDLKFVIQANTVIGKHEYNRLILNEDFPTDTIVISDLDGYGCGVDINNIDETRVYYPIAQVFQFWGENLLLDFKLISNSSDTTIKKSYLVITEKDLCGVGYGLFIDILFFKILQFIVVIFLITMIIFYIKFVWKLTPHYP